LAPAVADLTDRKVRSGCCGLLKGDVVSEACELFDEAAGLAFGVAGGVVVAAGSR
jgi:hypothetical protein